MSKLAIEARFSGYVRTVYSSALLDDVFAATAARVSGATLGNIGLGSEANVAGPARSVRYVAETEDAARLPRSGERCTVAAGTIADGYAADNANRANVDESKNKAQANLSISTGAPIPQ